MNAKNASKYLTLGASLLLFAGSASVFAQAPAGKASDAAALAKPSVAYVVEGANEEWLRSSSAGTSLTPIAGEHNLSMHQVEGENRGAGQGPGFTAAALPHDLKTHEVEGTY